MSPFRLMVISACGTLGNICKRSSRHATWKREFNSQRSICFHILRAGIIAGVHYYSSLSKLTLKDNALSQSGANCLEASYLLLTSSNEGQVSLAANWFQALGSHSPPKQKGQEILKHYLHRQYEQTTICYILIMLPNLFLESSYDKGRKYTTRLLKLIEIKIRYGRGQTPYANNYAG